MITGLCPVCVLGTGVAVPDQAGPWGPRPLSPWQLDGLASLLKPGGLPSLSGQRQATRQGLLPGSTCLLHGPSSLCRMLAMQRVYSTEQVWYHVS